MSREIKFRAWEKNPEDDVAHFIYNVVVGENVSYHVLGNSGFVQKMNDDDFVIEQYTGLKDKNGKGIYEGDIFRNAVNGGTWYVYWNEKDVAFWVDSGVGRCSLGDFDWDRSNRKYGFIRKNCEVIGNIHENGELLGGEE